MTDTAKFTEEQLNQFRPLPDKYSVDGTYFYSLYKRGNKAVIYEGSIGEDNPRKTCYEVFAIKVMKPTILKMGNKETFIPRREKVPSNEDFGKWALATPHLDRALMMFEEFENKKDEVSEEETQAAA